MLPIQPDKYYHIYNRGNNSEDLFSNEGDYIKFLALYEKYIHPIAETYAWVLMKNHFHLLVRIKEAGSLQYKLSREERCKDDIRFMKEKWDTIADLTASGRPVSVGKGDLKTYPINADSSDDAVKLHYCTDINADRSDDAVRLKKVPNPTLHFSHMFNAYAKYYNQKYNRTGSLFERRFKRIEVNSIEYFKTLLVYVHTNPVHHGFTDDFANYPWSSYQSLISSLPTKLKREEVVQWFNDIENLKYMHQKKINTQLISDILLE